MDRGRTSARFTWWIVLSVTGATTLALLAGPGKDLVWESPLALFVIVTIVAGICVVGAAGLLWVSHRDDHAEAGVLAGGLMATSLLPLVHGLTAPGVLYGPNDAVMTSAYLALPFALVIMVPLITGPGAIRAWVGARWRAWVTFWLVLVSVLAGVLLRWPNAITVPGSDHPMTWLVSSASLLGALALSRVQLTLHEIGHRRSTLVASLAFIFLGLTSLVWVFGQPFGAGWWAVHALDMVGVLAGIAGVWVGHRLDAAVTEVLRPVTALDPLAAMELGIPPVVHRFVAALGSKDQITRDHVVRTAELAIRTGQELGLGPRDLRRLGLGALLHDIGKLDVSDAILKKPGRLTAAEFRAMQRHVEVGERMLLAVPSLASSAAIVRSHHERVDGTGYPDGLRGAAIPLEARIVAACDGYDAMANTRQYRDAIDPDVVRAILVEHAGSQWDPEVVSAVLGAVASTTPTDHRLDSVGTPERACGCGDALPDEVLALIG